MIAYSFCDKKNCIYGNYVIYWRKLQRVGKEYEKTQVKPHGEFCRLNNGLQANIGSVIFVCLSLGAAVLQGIADIQMHKFRKNRTAPFIRTGLWKYSRHPNYLGELLM